MPKSIGQLAGGAGGLVLGALLAPVTAGGSFAALSAVSFGTVLGGAFLGFSVGSAVGGLVDPPKPIGPRGQHEVQELQFNTYSQDAPVPLLFGTYRVAGNLHYIGRVFGQVETVGQQTVGDGKSAQEVDVEAVVYYADFSIALGEGPFQSINRLLREDEDITDQEGELFETRLGTSDEEVPDIVTNSPIEVQNPVPWRNTAKVLYSGRIGQISRLPNLIADATGPDTTVIRSGPLALSTDTVRSFTYDELSDLFVAVNGDYTIHSFTKEGGSVRNAEVPNLPENVIDRAFYFGRGDVLLVFGQVVGGTRTILRGELGFNTSSAWQGIASGVPSMAYGIDAAIYDETNGLLWTVHRGAGGVFLVSTSFTNGTQEEYPLELNQETSGIVVHGLDYDRAEHRFYLLFSNAGELFVRRFSTEDPYDIAQMTCPYGHSTPLGIAVHGELFTIFDPGYAHPLVQYEWGRSSPRFERGNLFQVAEFDPVALGSLYLWIDPSQESYADLAAVPLLTNRGTGPNAVQTSSALQPRARLYGAHRVIEFLGDDYLDAGGGAGVQRDNCTVFIVHRPNGQTPSDFGVALAGRVGSSSNRCMYAGYGGNGNGSEGQVFYVESGNVLAAYDLDDNSIFEVTSLVSSEQTVRYFRNGVLQATADHEQTGIDTLIRIGAYTESALLAQYKGEIAEVLVFSRQLTEDERLQVEIWLAWRHGLSTHPGYSSYLDPGTRLIFADPQAFFYNPHASQLMVLDRDHNDWVILYFHWDGSNWSRVRASSYYHALFEERSSPAGSIYKALTSYRHGAFIPEGFVDIRTFERVSGFSNQPVNMRYYTTDSDRFEARHQLDYYLTVRRRLSDVLGEMLLAFNGFIVFTEGRIKLGVEFDSGVIEGHFDESNIIDGSFQFAEIAREDRVNEVLVRFTDKARDYKPSIAPYRAEWEVDLYREVRSKAFDASGVVRPRQAANIAYSSVLSSTNKRASALFRTGAMGLRYEVGDVVTVTHPDPGWVDKPMRIVKMREFEEDEIEITVFEHIPRVHIANGFPLQPPEGFQFGSGNLNQSAQESDYTVPKPPARPAIIEDTYSTQLFLFASRPTNTGPWNFMRWLVKWDQTQNPGSTIYPGQVPITGANYLLFLSTNRITNSGLLVESVTQTGTVLQLDCVLGDPGVGTQEAIIYNPSITAQQFANPNGNGKYERVVVSSYDPNVKQVTISSRGEGTNAVAHTVPEVAVARAYVFGFSNITSPVQQTPVPITVLNYSALGPSSLQGAAPFSPGFAVWYIGFDATAFLAAGGVNALKFIVSGNEEVLSTNPRARFKLDFAYSKGGTEFQELLGICDDTRGMTQSGRVSWDVPSDWATTNTYLQGSIFPNTMQGGTAPLMYVLRIRRLLPFTGEFGLYDFFDIQDFSPGVQGAPFWSPASLPMGSAVWGNRQISIDGAANLTAKGLLGRVVYFLSPNTQPVYDFSPSEQAHTLLWKAQPAGPHGELVDLDGIPATPSTILNLAGEGT